MEKEQIIAEIKRQALQNDGKPLGVERFERSTGIKRSAWAGKFWTRWSDAIREAGFPPNSMNPAYSDDELLEPLASLIRKFGHFPTGLEQRLHRRNDPDFPTPHCITNRWGKKGEVAARVIDWCLERGGFDDVVQICSPIATARCPLPEDDSGVRAGQVYMLKHNNEYKIGESVDAARRYKELKTQMPFVCEEIHVIDTDDRFGIETYGSGVSKTSDSRANGSSCPPMMSGRSSGGSPYRWAVG